MNSRLMHGDVFEPRVLSCVPLPVAKVSGPLMQISSYIQTCLIINLSLFVYLYPSDAVCLSVVQNSFQNPLYLKLACLPS